MMSLGFGWISAIFGIVNLFLLILVAYFMIVYIVVGYKAIKALNIYIQKNKQGM